MLLYPNLVQYSNDLEVQPELAESWTMSADGMTWTFKVRSGAVWSDGKPITSKDAAFTINTMVKCKAMRRHPGPVGPTVEGGRPSTTPLSGSRSPARRRLCSPTWKSRSCPSTCGRPLPRATAPN